MILKGKVVSNQDYSQSMRISVIFEDSNEGVASVVYTSPYYNYNGGGVLAPPEPGTDVLVFKDSDSSYYYISTIVDPIQIGRPGGIKEWKVIPEPEKVYSEQGTPDRMTFENKLGAGLVINRKFESESISNRVALTSEHGKKVLLDDSPKSDCVVVRNEHGDGLVISGDESDVFPERVAELKTKGYQRFVVFNSGMELSIIEGRDINIENQSTGAFSNLNSERFGNINLRSENNDISLVTKAPDGRIFLITPNARIQIESNGRVVIESSSNIELNSNGNITLNSANTLSLQASNINIKSDGATSISSGGNLNLDGSQVHLQQGSPVPEAQIQNPSRNHYDE